MCYMANKYASQNYEVPNKYREPVSRRSTFDQTPVQNTLE